MVGDGKSIAYLAEPKRRAQEGREDKDDA